VGITFYDFVVFDPSLLTLWINCWFIYSTCTVFICILPVVVARSSFDGISNCNTLCTSGMWITPCFHETDPVAACAAAAASLQCVHRLTPLPRDSGCVLSWTTAADKD